MDRQSHLFDLSADPRGAAKMGEVGRQPIAYVDACCCEPPPQQSLSHVKTRLRKEVRLALSGGHFEDAPTSSQHGRQLRRRAAKLACHVERIPGSAPAAA